MGAQLILKCLGRLPVNLVRLQRVAGLLLHRLGRAHQELNIMLADDATIRGFNAKWLQRDRPTNCISFQGEDGVLGDIIISLETAQREAEGAGCSLQQRVEELFIHGLVHLLGYDHEAGEREAEEMAEEELRLRRKLAMEVTMADLCVNVDHIATIRQARGTVEPDPVWGAAVAELAGADGIVVHLREDRRHIQDRDVRLLRQTVRSRLTLEMAATDEMIEIARDVRPDIVTLVPERREELTTEGGLDVVGLKTHVEETIKRLNDAGIPVSLFIDPEEAQIEASKEVGAQCIELHTGRYADASSEEEQDQEFENLARSASMAFELGLRVHAGHGLTYNNVARLAALPEIAEFSIGHSIIARAVVVGLEKAVRDMNALIKRGFVA